MPIRRTDADDEDAYESTSQRLARFHDLTLAATTTAVAQGHKPHHTHAIEITKPECVWCMHDRLPLTAHDRSIGVNVPFLQSGQQFSPSSSASAQMTASQRLHEAEYRSASQRLADYHARTANAVAQAALEGAVPASPALGKKVLS